MSSTSRLMFVRAYGIASGLREIDVLRRDRAGRPARGLVVAPVEVRVRDDELRRRRAPRGEILGRMGIAHEGRVIAADECAVQRRAHAFVCLRSDHDEAPDGELAEQRLERRLLERVRITLLDVRLVFAWAQLRDDLP